MIWVLAAWTSYAVDFQKDIQPLLKNKCSRCHSGHEAKGGFSINTRTTLLDGAKPGDSAGSLLYQLITSKDPDERMPSKGEPLAAEEIALIKTWINEGIAWPEGYNFANWRRARRQLAKLYPSGHAMPSLIQVLIRAISSAANGSPLEGIRSSGSFEVMS